MVYRRHSRYVLSLFVCIGALLLAACEPKPAPQPKTPPALSPTAPDALSMATNLVRGYLAVAIGRDNKAESGGIYAREIDPKTIYLPAVDVYLQDTKTSAVSKEVRTDLSGRFTLQAPAAAEYRLCWKSKVYGDGCAKKVFAGGAQPAFLSTILIDIPHKDGFVASYGRVRFKDNSIPRTLEPLAGINAYAVVTLLDENKNALSEVPVNNFGDYLLPYLPAKDKTYLVASIEGAKTLHDVQPDNFRNNPRLVSYHLTINNTPPRLDGIVPRNSGGKRMQLANPGDKINLKAVAHDRDGDALKVIWLESPGAGVLSAKTGTQINWTLPAEKGRYATTAIVSDGKGGYARFKVRMDAGAAGVAFGGVVAGTDGTLLKDAEIDINGKLEKTNGKGRFLSFVPEADKYVLNIRKSGYGFYSRVYDRTVAGGRWTLTTATVVDFDPTKEISLQDKRSGRNCPGPETARINWKEDPRYTQVWWQDGKGNNVPPPSWYKDNTPDTTPVDGKTIVLDNKDVKDVKEVKEMKDIKLGKAIAKPGRDKNAATGKANNQVVILPWEHNRRIKHGDCGPGISVKIPANGLQLEGGGAPTGPVELSLSTVDLYTPEQMPGEDAVQTASGSIGWMQSYGAGSIELREKATGKRLNLRPGVEADVSIPVDRSQLMAGGALPAQIPLLYYNESTGVWKEEHKLTLDAAKQNYTTKVKHFSTLNTDVTFTNPSCIRVEDATMNLPYELEVTIPMANGAAPKVKKITIAAHGPHVVYSLPNNVNITMVAYRASSPPTPAKVLGVFVVNSGAPQASGFSPPPPATACSTTVALSEQTFPQAPAPGGEFLHGLYSFAATNIDELSPADATAINNATLAYYAAIDPPSAGFPNGERATLDGFKTKNGFTAGPGFQLCGGNVCDNPDQEINVAFANSGDLGFGRDMHCRRTNTASGYDYACYVSNYGDIVSDDALDADNARNNSGLIATVAMEYSRILPGDPITDRHVKFYVYNSAGNRINAADLDAYGARPVPQLCMVCHGGAYPSGPSTGVASFPDANSAKLGSKFLPFDIRFYTFPASPDKGAQQTAMKKLNQDIVKFAPGSTAINEVVDAMYANNSATQKEEFVVPGWEKTQLPLTTAQEHFYKRAVGNACRTCHIAQPFADLQFRSATTFTSDWLATAEYRVCDDSQHVMPHARRTHDIFWGQFWPDSFGAISPTIAAQFQVYGDTLKQIPVASKPAGWVGTWPPAWSGEVCGTFQAGGASSPPSYYSTVVHPQWSRNYNTGGGNQSCAGCHSGLFTGSASTVAQGLVTNGYIVGGNQGGSLVLQKILADPDGTPNNGNDRMPRNCPTATLRCLNEGAGYDPNTDTNPATTTHEVNRIKHWINTGANP